MDNNELNSILGNVDIYLLDQVMKKRYSTKDKILDAGCGNGRNLFFLERLGYSVEACDMKQDIISKIKNENPRINIILANLEELPYLSNTFDHIICNAVLHFAKSNSHFYAMINELIRVLKIEGSLFIRMTSVFGLNDSKYIGEGRHKLSDGTTRFLLTNKHISYIKSACEFIEPIKTVNVDNQRCMSTLMLKKKK